MVHAAFLDSIDKLGFSRVSYLEAIIIFIMAQGFRAALCQWKETRTQQSSSIAKNSFNYVHESK